MPDTWDGEVVDYLWEELETGLLARLVKTRHGNVLRAAPDGPERYLDDRHFYISAALEYVGHLDEDGLDTAPGLLVRQDGRPLGWWVAYVNSREGGPALAQLVVSRRSRHEAAIEHVQLLPGTSDLVGWSLVNVAIHHAARRGMHRLYSPSRLEHVHPFAFIKAASDEVVYDIRFNDLNWPATLPTSGTTNG